MPAELGGSQISSLLEALPGIACVLRSPVADALIKAMRGAAGIADFAFEDAEELVRYAVRRGLIGPDEGERVLPFPAWTPPAARSPPSPARRSRRGRRRGSRPSGPARRAARLHRDSPAP